MTERFTWKGEITFNGTSSEFAKFAEALNDRSEVEVKVSTWWPPRPFPGYPPWPWWRRIPKETVNKIIKGGPKLKVMWIKDIAGGIRDPHIHLADGIVLLDRERFKLMVSEIASMLATERLDHMGDFVSVMAPIQELEATPIEIP